MAISADQLQRAVRRFARDIFTEPNATAVFDVDQLRTSVSGIDSVFDTYSSEFNDSLDVDVRADGTIEQKALLVAVAALARGGFFC